MLTMKGAILLAFVLLLSAAANAKGTVRASTYTRPITVRCNEIIGTAQTGRDGGRRIVLGIVSAPQAFLPQLVRVPEFAPFPYWQKAGMVIRSSGKPVTVTVPKPWRSHLRIGWGNPAPEATAVTFAPCSSSSPTWNAYAGGFFLRGGAACVPLAFSVGNRHATLRFGVGRKC
jgi:hypothetical protein